MSRGFMGNTPCTFGGSFSSNVSDNLSYGFDIGKTINSQTKSYYAPLVTNMTVMSAAADFAISPADTLRLNVPYGTTERDLAMGTIRPGHGQWK